MKNIFFILLTLILFSCVDNNEVVISKQEYNRLKGIKKSEYPKQFHFEDELAEGWEWKIILGEDNHEYIRNEGGNGFILIHYPDCNKCLKRDTL